MKEIMKLLNRIAIVILGMVIFLGAIFWLESCNATHHRHHHKKVKMTEYKVTKGNSDVFVWYYIILANDNSYYYYQSSTKVTSFNNLTWTKALQNPINAIDEEEIEEENDLSVDEGSMGITPDVEEDISNQESETEGESEWESEGSDGSSDAGSGDGGDSGGDGGGGDGGGGE